MSLSEIINILDENGHIAGTMSRDDAEAANLITPNVLMFIFTPDGRVWIQHRPLTKKHFPGLWDISACGGITEGETPEQAAARELHEEMGIQTELRHVETFLNVFPGDEPGQVRRRYSHLYIGISDQQPRTNEEVDAFKSFPYAKLRSEVQAHPDRYVPSFLIELDKATAAYLDQAKA